MNFLFKFSMFGFLTAGMIAACSDGHDTPSSHSHETHASEHNTAEETHVASKTITGKTNTGVSDNKDVRKERTDNGSVSRSANAHTHGDAKLAIVLENERVTIEFDSPAYNLLGFEHIPETQAQKAAVKQAELKLSGGAALFVFNSEARCTPQSNPENISFFGADTHDEADEHHDEHDNVTHDSHDKEDEHDDDNHADLIVSYQFQCEKFEKLSNVKINLFEFFEKLSEVDATLLGAAVQRQVTLNRKQSQLDLTQ